MSRAEARAGGRERFKIARGAVGNMGPFLTLFLAGAAAWLVGTLVLLPAFHASPAVLGGATAGGLLVLVATLLVYLNLPGWVEIGAEGLMIDWRDRREYLPFAEILDAPPYSEHVVGKTFVGVLLGLRGGTPVKLPIGEDHFGGSEQAAQLSARIRAALEGYRRRDEDDAPAILARRDRPVDEWHRHLRALGEGANAGPREAPLPPDRLFRIVESPTAAAPMRAAAAVALAGTIDDEGRKRLRIAAEATAAPKLRVALESVAAGDEEAVVAALAGVEGEAGR